MNHPLWRKYFSESVLLLAALALGVTLFGWFRVWIVGELDTAQFRQIIDLLPKDWRRFATVDFDWLVSYLGRTATTLDEPMLISLICGWSIIRGSDVVSGELGRGTMEMLLAQPISRREHYLRHAAYTVGLLALLTGLVWLGMSLGVWTSSVEETTYPEIRIPLIDYRIPLRFLKAQTETIAMVTEVNPVSFLPGILNLFCVGVFFGGLSACLSSIDRYRWRTLGLLVAFYFTNAGLKVLGMGSETFAWVENVSVFGLYHPANAIQSVDQRSAAWFELFQTSTNPAEVGQIVGFGMSINCLALIGLGAALYGLGLIAFQRRDLPAPV